MGQVVILAVQFVSDVSDNENRWRSLPGPIVLPMAATILFSYCTQIIAINDTIAPEILSDKDDITLEGCNAEWPTFLANHVD